MKLTKKSILKDTMNHSHEEMLAFAKNLCRGYYQQGIVSGRYRISGSDLSGKTKRYSAHYARSAANVIERCQNAGIPIKEVIGDHGRRDVVIG